MYLLLSRKPRMWIKRDREFLLHTREREPWKEERGKEQVKL